MQRAEHSLYSRIAPAIKRWMENPEYKHYWNETDPRPYRGTFNLEVVHDIIDSESATFFDCRSIPTEFIIDTGKATKEEWEATNHIVRLPYSDCFFELYDGYGIMAHESSFAIESLDDDTVKQMAMGEYEGKEDKDIYVSFVPFSGWDDPDLFEDSLSDCSGEFYNGIDILQDGEKPRFFTTTNSDHDVDDVLLERAAVRLLGILSLLSEKLVTETIEPDPAPRLSARRRNMGRLPLTGPRHILRVNVPAVRRVARNTPIGSHESPCLHWRRGHWRTLHRYSEFESQTWVKKCLVGDPDKGFVTKSYKLVHEMPMMKETAI